MRKTAAPGEQFLDPKQFLRGMPQEALNLSVSCAIVVAVNTSISLEEPAAGNISAERKSLEPCSIIIFGASGDLTARKLIPAFYHLCKDNQMPRDFRVIGFARRDKTDESWRNELRGRSTSSRAPSR